MSYFSLFSAVAALGFFDTPAFITTVQYSEPSPTFTGQHVGESNFSRGQCWNCRRMIGKRGESYTYSLRLVRGYEELHACKRCHHKLARRRSRR